ncbi:MAG: hypothetical protein KDC82_01275, partial [Bacteroidetes bacterium]|nr:hypothetical protein [Bacteroidota bacterium]
TFFSLEAKAQCEYSKELVDPFTQYVILETPSMSLGKKYPEIKLNRVVDENGETKSFTFLFDPEGYLCLTPESYVLINYENNTQTRHNYLGDKQCTMDLMTGKFKIEEADVKKMKKSPISAVRIYVEGTYKDYMQIVRYKYFQNYLECIEDED